MDFFLINVNKFQYFKVYFEKVSTKSEVGRTLKGC